MLIITKTKQKANQPTNQKSGERDKDVFYTVGKKKQTTSQTNKKMHQNPNSNLNLLYIF